MKEKNKIKLKYNIINNKQNIANIISLSIYSFVILLR